MERTITVKGKGYASAPPDTVQVDMVLEATRETYELAMRDAAHKLELLREALAPHGFEKEDLKTLTFSVDSHYEYQTQPSGEAKRVFLGYRYHHQLRIEFPVNQDRLAKILSSLSGSQADVEFSIHFKLKDRKSVEEALLIDAMLDARQKARVLCEEAEVELGAVLSITYDWKEVELYAQPVFSSARLLMEESAASMDLEPQEVENSDTVTVVWEIGPTVS